MTASGPVRTCIGCRRRVPASELVRLQLVDGQVKVWAKIGRGAGRGASIHAQASCIEAASRSNAFARAFKQPGASIAPPDFSSLTQR